MAISVTSCGGGGGGDWRKDGTNTTVFTSDTYNYIRMLLADSSSSYSYIYPNTYFNMNVRISDTTNYCASMFSGCPQMNGEVILGNNVKECQYMFSDCNRFNKPINIPNSVLNCDHMFFSDYMFNQPIHISQNVYACNYMLWNAQRLNQSVYIGQNVGNSISYGMKNFNCFQNMFGLCLDLDPDKIIIDSDYITTGANFEVYNTSNSRYGNNYYGGCVHVMWYGTQVVNWNKRNDIGIGSTNTAHAFVMVNGEYGNTTTRAKYNVGYFFQNASAGSNSFIIADENVYGAGYSNNAAAEWFNYGPIHIGNNVTNCSNCFLNYYNFNYNVTIGSSVENCSNMFRNCQIFDKSISIPNSVINCTNMFTNAYRMNPNNAILHNGVVNCNNMFVSCVYGVRQLNFVIPESVTDCGNMFASCTSITGNIYICNENIGAQKVHRIINGTSSSYQKNIFCNNIEVLNNTSYTITGNSVTWVPMLNGYYNSTYNVYIYNNMPNDL